MTTPANPPGRCEFNWGSHGCSLPADHEGDHRCVGENGCGGAVGQDGRDAGGFKWDLWGPVCDTVWGADSDCQLVRGHRERDGTGHVDQYGNPPAAGLPLYGESA